MPDAIRHGGATDRSAPAPAKVIARDWKAIRAGGTLPMGNFECLLAPAAPIVDKS
jgi:hypothetical protein